jgi:hypothetical protein
MSVQFLPETASTLSAKVERFAPSLPFHQYIQQVPHPTLKEDQRFVLQETLLKRGRDNRDRGTCVISFRGTETGQGVLTALDDVGTDIRNFNFRSLPIQSDLGKSARFERNFQHIQNVIEVFFGGYDQIQGGHNALWDFYTTGHSLGGALADTLALTDVVHGGYSFSPPVDNQTGSRRNIKNPTFRSINQYDRVIAATDTQTDGRTRYDMVVQMPATIQNQAGHSLVAFKEEGQVGPFGLPRYNPGNLDYMLPASVVEMPGKSLRSAVRSISGMAESIASRLSRRVRNRMIGLPTTMGRGKRRERRSHRGSGPPPSYHMALKMAEDAYNPRITEPLTLKDELQEADLCPSPISTEEVKFYIVYWPRFNNPEDKLAVEPLAKIVFGELVWGDEEMGLMPSSSPDLALETL